MAPGGPLSVAINASLDPYAAGGVQANLNGLIRTLRQRPASSAMTLLAAPVTTESWNEIGGDVFSVVPWPFPLAWYREPMQGRSPTLAEMLRALRHRLGRTSLKQHDDFLRRLGVELVHFPHQLHFQTGLPFVYEPWDLQHVHLPGFFSEGERLWRDRLYRDGCRRARLVVAATAWSKADFVRHMGVPASKVAVVYRGSLNASMRLAPRQRDAVLARLGVQPGFAFYPATAFPHKNHLRLLYALAKLRDEHGIVLPTVFSGRRLDPFSREIEATIARLHLDDQVRVLGEVTEEELSALYHEARLLVFPSLFEGLGLPVVEAMQHGLPVLAADAACLPEVVGDAGMLFDGADVEAITATLRRFFAEPRHADAMRAAAGSRAQEYSWERAAATYAACYRHAAGRRLTEAQEALLEEALSR